MRKLTTLLIVACAIAMIICIVPRMRFRRVEIRAFSDDRIRKHWHILLPGQTADPMKGTDCGYTDCGYIIKEYDWRGLLGFHGWIRMQSGVCVAPHPTCTVPAASY